MATQFWLSPYGNSLGSTPPANLAAVPTLYNFVTQTTGSVYVWAIPDATKTLKNWSLRLNSESAANIIKFTSAEVYNPVLGGDPNNVRWEYEIEPDSNSPTSGEFMGFTLTNEDLTGNGIATATFMNDPYYFGPLDGSGAWLLAKVNYKALNVVGSTELFLQIGRLGLNNAGELSGATTVTFGHTGEDPIASSVRLTSTGSKDATVQVLATPDADFDTDLNGEVSGIDFLIWQRKFGLNSGATNHMGDANGDGIVNNIDLAAWEFQYGTIIPVAPLGGLSGLVVPEPSTVGLSFLAVWCTLTLVTRRGVP